MSRLKPGFGLGMGEDEEVIVSNRSEYAVADLVRLELGWLHSRHVELMARSDLVVRPPEALRAPFRGLLQRGPNERWAEHRDADLTTGELQLKRFGECDHCIFRHRVRAVLQLGVDLETAD